MNPSLKWKKGQCNGDQVVPDIDFEQKSLNKRKFNKTLDERLNTRHTTAPTLTTNTSSDANNDMNATNGHNTHRNYHRNHHQNNGLHNNNAKSITTLDEFWEERYSRILTHNIFSNNSIGFAESK